MRVAVYVDGFNLYYRALKGTSHKWLDIHKLAFSVLNADDAVVQIRYFTARVSSRAADPDAPRRQQAYLNALATLPNLRVHYGRFLPKTKFRPLVSDPKKFVEIHDTEEKGSDVNLASHLLHDGWSGKYEAALVISQDSDLIEPMRMVKNELKRPIGLLWLDGQEPSLQFRNVSSFVRHATAARLAASQFPSPLMGRNGHLIHKPENW